jgi:hypothetical protein
MFTRRNHLAMQQIGFTYGFFLRELFFDQAQRFRTIARSPVSRDRFVKRKDPLGLDCSLFGVLQTTLVIAGLDVVMGQLLDCTGKLIPVLLESFGDVPM